MNKKTILAMKIVTIILIAAVEILVWHRIWIGNDLVKSLHAQKAYIILTLLIVIISVIDKAVLLIIDLFKGIKDKEYRIKRIHEIEIEVIECDKTLRKIPFLFHIMIFENLWLLILVFCLHSAEWIVNGIALSKGEVHVVEYYSLGMRAIEYPIVTITLIVSYFRDKKRINNLMTDDEQKEEELISVIKSKMTGSKKIVFMGTPEYAKVVLQGLVENDYEVSLVVTQPDKTVGRKKEIVYSQVKQFAIDNNIELFQPVKIRNDYAKIKEIKPDLIITAAYGQIIPKEVLDIPQYGCINLHGSILPKYRGGAPIQWSIMNGEEKTGVSLMYMDEKMDTGDIIDIKEIDIKIDDNLQTVFDKMSLCAKEILLKNIEDIFNNKNNRTAQNHEDATFAWNIKKEDEFIDMMNWDANKIHNHCRGLFPYIVGNIEVNGVKYKLHETKYHQQIEYDIEPLKFNKVGKKVFFKAKNNEVIEIIKIQKIGKKVISASDFANQI